MVSDLELALLRAQVASNAKTIARMRFLLQQAGNFLYAVEHGQAPEQWPGGSARIRREIDRLFSQPRPLPIKEAPDYAQDPC